MSIGTLSSAHSASQSRSICFGSLTCGTGRKIGALTWLRPVFGRDATGSPRLLIRARSATSRLAPRRRSHSPEVILPPRRLRPAAGSRARSPSSSGSAGWSGIILCRLYAEIGALPAGDLPKRNRQLRAKCRHSFGLYRMAQASGTCRCMNMQPRHETKPRSALERLHSGWRASSQLLDLFARPGFNKGSQDLRPLAQPDEFFGGNSIML